MNKKDDPIVLFSWLEACEENIDRLSTWEMEFIESIRRTLDKYGKLSEKQAETLERIYTEKTP